MELRPRRRALRFLAVGWLGFLVQIAALAALTSAARWPWLPATCAGVEAAIVHNFLWHERWTWRDRTHSEAPRRRLIRFAQYNAATGLVALTGNVVLTAVFLAALHAPAILANALAVATLTIVNFVVADRWIFRSRSAAL